MARISQIARSASVKSVPSLVKKPMQEHTMTLQEQEFKLVRRIRQIGGSREQQDAMIETLIQEIETYLTQQSPKKPIKWLQEGNLKRFREFNPVKPESGSPLASDIIIEQRRQR